MNTASAQQHSCDLRVGTCGYSYTEWRDAGFYPAGTQPARMLPLYARQFSVTELNHTWYQMPRAEAIERQRKLTPEGFLFSVKLTRTLTHEVEDEWKKQVEAFRNGVAPIAQSGQLAAVLAQLPTSFDRSMKHREYLAALLDELGGLPVAVEFRHASWAQDKVFDELARRKVTLVAVDEPELPHLFPALDAVTNPELFYVRFHGRNAKGWFSGSMQQQFDYDYSDDELREWVKEHIARMAKQSKRGILVFNNHVRGKAPRNAQRIKEILQEYGLTV